MLAGHPRNYTTGSLRRAIVLLAIPMVLEMMMQAVFEIADVFFVGKLGPDAVAAVGYGATLLVLVFAVGIGLSMAAAATVARRIGEGDTDAAARAAFQAIGLAAIVSIPVAIGGGLGAADLLRLMGATESVVATGTSYFRWMFVTNIVVLLLFLINAIFRGVGDAIFAMRALWIANILNIILDPILIFGFGPIPAMGVTGAAVATVIGRAIGVAYQLRVLTSGRLRIRVQRKHMEFRARTVEKLVRLSLPAVVQYLVGTASWIGVVRILAEFGSAVVAGYTIAVRVIVFAMLPSWGMGNAAATLVGQNLGAGKPDRSAKSVWYAGAVNAVFLSIFGVIMLLFGEEIIMLFTDDPGAIATGALCLSIVAFSYPAFAYGMVVVQAFNGAGDTTSPTIINLIAYWLFQIPLALVLAFTMGLEARGVFTAIAFAQVVLAVLAVLWFRTGRWKDLQV